MINDLNPPFPVNGCFEPEDFCDRDNKLKTLDAYTKGSPFIRFLMCSK